jgi:hypothetical protein
MWPSEKCGGLVPDCQYKIYNSGIHTMSLKIDTTTNLEMITQTGETWATWAYKRSLARWLLILPLTGNSSLGPRNEPPAYSAGILPLSSSMTGNHAANIGDRGHWHWTPRAVNPCQQQHWDDPGHKWKHECHQFCQPQWQYLQPLAEHKAQIEILPFFSQNSWECL